jgi:cysteine-rich repeat protein
MKKNLLILSLFVGVLMIGVVSAAEVNFSCGGGILNSSVNGFCDDGNDVNGDGCSSTCVIEVCGDGITNNGEECDGEANCLDDCTIDDEGPSITNIHTNTEWLSCNDDSYVIATITDESGIPEINPPSLPIILHWKYDGYPWANIPFTTQPVVDIYSVRIPLEKRANAQLLQYYIEARDNLSNVAFSGNSSTVYDCANPIASVLGAPSSWEDEAIAEADCDDDASGCDLSSYKLYASDTDMCSMNLADYSSSPLTITEYSYVCSYVEDNADNSDFSGPFEFLVDGVDPTANANGPYDCDEGKTIMLDSSGSTDDHSIVSYDWDFDEATGANPEYTCGNGDNTEGAVLTVTDHVGNIDSDEAIINVHNVAPVLDSLEEFTCNEGEDVILTASASDFDEVLTYTWDTDGDGVYEDSPTYHCVEGPDVITVSVKVSDDEGAEDTASTIVTINNVAPVANASGTYECNEGETITLTASATDAGILDILNYVWTIDGTDFTGQSVDYTCIDGKDVIDASVTVTDNDGASDSDSTTIEVANMNPVLTDLTEFTCNEGETITLTASATDVPADIADLVYYWTINGTDLTGQSVDYTCLDGPAILDVTVVVEDDDGSSEDNSAITVTNLNPTADAGGDQDGIATKQVCFDGSGSSDPAGSYDPLEYSWDFGNGDTGSGVSPCTFYSETGEYTVTLTVNDSDEGKDSDTVVVHIHDYIIELDAMCNLISIPLVPANISVEAVLGVATPNSVWAYKVNENGTNEWSFYTSTSGDLDEMIPGYGYYVCTNKTEAIYGDGEKYYELGISGVSMPPQVELTTGWNLIGHYGMNDVPKFLEKQDLSGGDLTDLADVTLLGKDASPNMELNPGVGYWAFITGQTNLEYAPSPFDYNEEECFGYLCWW